MTPFEAALSAYTEIPHALATCSGTAALHLALEATGVGEGDEVWCPTLTFIGGVSPVLWVGADPVFFDCDEYLTIDTTLFEGLEPPKAIIATDLFGQLCDWSALQAYCDDHNVILIADSAEAVGSLYHGKHSGYHADIAVYSFNNNKIITTLGGGMVASHNKDWIDRARFLANQAKEPGWYVHREIGYNYRMNGHAERTGVEALKTIEDKVAKHRLMQTCLPEREGTRSNRWMAISRDITMLGRDGVRPMFRPMHMQEVFAEFEYVGGNNAETAFREMVCVAFTEERMAA